MKLKIEIEIDVGDLLDEKSDDEIAQILYDGYVNYATTQHLSDAVTYCSLGKVGSESPDYAYARLYNYHNTWGEICSSATWTFSKPNLV